MSGRVINLDHIMEREIAAPEPDAQRRNGHAPRGAQGAAPLPVVPYSALAARPRIAQRCLIDGLLPAEEPLLLSGKERSFKSFLTMEWCKAVACGRDLFATYGVPAALPVVMLDLENTRSRLCDRMDAALAHDGLSSAHLGDRLHVLDRDEMQAWHCDSAGLDRLEATLAALGPALVVIDNLRKCMPPGKDEKDAKDMLPVVNALARLAESYHTALVLVHHDRRDGTGYSGSGSITGALGNDVHVKYSRKTRIASVYCESMRNSEPFAPFAVAMGPDGALMPTELPEDEEDDDDDYGHKVVDALRPGARSVRELCDLTGLNRAQVVPTVQRLKATGEVVEAGERAGGRGKPAKLYGLAALPPQ